MQIREYFIKLLEETKEVWQIYATCDLTLNTLLIAKAIIWQTGKTWGESAYKMVSSITVNFLILITIV